MKFGYPETLIADYRHWCVVLRPAQATLGALVMICKEDATNFSAISAAAFGEFASVVCYIEEGSKAFRPWDKINYLMLMMVDPNVHFHVLPRYAERQEFDGVGYDDTGWPGQPDLAGGPKLSSDQIRKLAAVLKASWPKSAAS